VLSEVGLVEDSISLLDAVKKAGGSINIYNYNAALSACKKHKQFNRCLKLFEELQQLQLQPQSNNDDDSNSNSNISPDSNGTKEKKDTKDSIEPDKVTLSIVISSLAELGQWEKAKVLFDTFESRYNTRDPILYSTLLR